ncbi:MAG: hypothetical protein AAFP82_16605, partial [Bacteroidota bacterium]
MKHLKILFVSFLVLGLWACDKSEQIDPSLKEGDIYLITEADFGRFKQLFYYNDENLLIRWMLFEEEQLTQIHDYEYMEDRKRKHDIIIYEEEEEYTVSGIEIFNEDQHPVQTINAVIQVENRKVIVEKGITTYDYDSTG